MADKTGIQTEIEFLAALERREVVSQPALAKRLSISVGMVNALLKRAAHKGLVKAKAAPYKRWAYYVTPEGFEEKSRLVARYLDASATAWRAYLRKVATKLEPTSPASNPSTRRRRRPSGGKIA